MISEKYIFKKSTFDSAPVFLITWAVNSIGIEARCEGLYSNPLPINPFPTAFPHRECLKTISGDKDLWDI